MEHARHVLRAGFVLLVAIASFAVVRAFALPRSYGLHGPYRHDNVAEQAARAPRHAGAESCKDCHEKQWTQRVDGEVHMAVSCEVCHGPLAQHVSAGKKIAEMPVDRSWQLCARCHRKLQGRPAEFPQVVLEQHVKGSLEPGICRKCHEPHSTFFE